jgi:hypothetical protein
MLFLPASASIAGIPLQAGRYILMTIPGPERWTVVLSTSDARTPTEMFNALTEVGRADVRAETLDAPVEKLTIRTVTDTAGVQLILEWERTRVRIPVKPS